MAREAVGTDGVSRRVDAFHDGRFALAHAPGGHRPGLDALLLAASVPHADPLRVADLGSGAGAVGLAIAERLPKARVTLYENDPASAADARATLTLEDNAHLAERIGVVEGDVTARGGEREALGLVAGAFDHIVANPPFDPDGRPSPDPRRARAHVLAPDTFEAWSRTAAAALAPGGWVTFIIRPRSLPTLFLAWSRRFSGPSVLPLHTKPGAAATRLLVRGRTGSREELRVLPGLTLDAGRAAALAAGTATIDMEAYRSS